MTKHMDKRLVGCAIVEGLEDIDVGDVGELNTLLGETLDVLPKGLVEPLPTIVEIP